MSNFRKLSFSKKKKKHQNLLCCETHCPRILPPVQPECSQFPHTVYINRSVANLLLATLSQSLFHNQFVLLIQQYVFLVVFGLLYSLYLYI